MRTQEVILVLQRLSKLKPDVIPVPEGTGFPGKVLNVVRDKETGRVISVMVNKKEYMNWLESTYSLVKKGTNLCHLLKS